MVVRTALMSWVGEAGRWTARIFLQLDRGPRELLRPTGGLSVLPGLGAQGGRRLPTSALIGPCSLRWGYDERFPIFGMERA